MKRVFCLLLTLLMILGCSVSALAAEKAANMPVRGIAHKNGCFVVGFMENEKGYVDLDTPLAGNNYQGDIYFGKTVYIALVNDKYDPDIISKMSSYSSTLSAKNAAENELNAAKTAAGNLKLSDLSTYKSHKSIASTEAGKLVGVTEYASASDLEISDIDTLLTTYGKTERTSKSSVNEVKTALNDIVTTLGGYITKLENLDEKQKAYDAITLGTDPSSTYMFVNESVAVANAKVTTSGFSANAKKFIDASNISIVRKIAVSNYLYGFKNRTTINNASSNNIYFIAMPIAEYNKLNSNIDMLDGTIRVRKTSGNDYNEFDYKFEFYFFPTYNIASGESSYRGTITKDPQWFDEDFWLGGDEEYEFSFAEDPSSYFVVNTERQTKAVQLSFDVEYPEDEYDYLCEHEGWDVDVQFYNGKQTGANFTKRGTLYLYWWGDGKAFVYKINDDEAKTLTYMPDVKKDTDYYYEDCYAIPTNKLERYLISSRPLSITQLSDVYVGPTQEELDAQAAAEAEAARIKAEQEEAARKAAEEEAARKAAEEAARKAAEEEAARLAEEAKKAAEEQQAKPITPAIEKDEGMPIIAWVAIVGGIILVVIAVGVMFYTRGNSKKNSSESSNSNKNNSNKRRML